MDNGGEATAELAFSLLSLGKSLCRGEPVFSVGRGTDGSKQPVVTYVHDSSTSELVAVLAGRKVGEDCGEEKVPEAKGLPGRPRKQAKVRSSREV